MLYKRILISTSRPLALILISCALMVPAAYADTAKMPSLVFASIQEGATILAEHDEFVQRLSPFDRAARLKTSKDVSEAEYIHFVKRNVMNWSPSEQALVERGISELRPQLQALSLEWPRTIYLIKTSGKEEGGAAYTRGNAIVLPSVELVLGTQQSLKKIIAHELFHILTRSNDNLKEQLYASIGFHQCGEIAFPVNLRSVKITNPDAPKNDHCIRLTVAGRPTWAIPILYSHVAKYDEGRGGEFFDYLNAQFLLLDGNEDRVPRNATYNEANVRLVDINGIPGFLEQVGKNTDYVIHPEEILADNFALLIQGESRVPSPEILNGMRTVFEQARRK
jgi:hypothetical protein